MPEKQLHVELLASTPNPEQICSLAAKLCYAKADVDSLREKINAQDQSAFLEKIMESKHLSVLEHASFTFAIEGVSRVLLAQLTRHRIASFSVQSQRYVSLAGDNFAYITPPAIKALGFELRCCSRAQWEIRSLANEMLRLCKEVAPVLFEKAGPGCVRGACPEGGKTCGKAADMRKYYLNK